MFQFVAAVISGVRLTIVAVWYLLTRSPSSRRPEWILLAGVLRTGALGGIIYVPAVDDHNTHDKFLTAYVSLTLVWFWNVLRFTQGNKALEKAHSYRKRIAIAYCVFFVPLIHYLTQYRIYQVPGAYSKYAFFEWASVALDLAFDCVSTIEFENLELRVYDIKGATKGPGLDLYARAHYV